MAIINPTNKMAKNKYQNNALDYAEDYLDRIFGIEDSMDRRLEERIGAIVEEKLQQYNLINNKPKKF